MGRSLRTPSTKKGRGTSGGEGASRRALVSPSLGEGVAASQGEGREGLPVGGRKGLGSCPRPEEPAGEVKDGECRLGRPQAEPRRDDGRGEREEGELESERRRL